MRRTVELLWGQAMSDSVNGLELGLGVQPDLVYRTMLRRPRWRLSDLVRELGWDDGGTRDVVGALRAEGFVVSSADDPDAIRAVEPCVALPALAAKRMRGPTAGTCVPKAAAVERFVTWHERAAEWSGEHRHPGGLDEVAAVVERLVAGVMHEVTMLVPTYVPGSFEFATQVAEAVLRRGASFRAIWCAEFTMAPPVLAHARWLGQRGCAPRAAQVVPTRAVVMDGTVAVLLDDIEAPRVLRGARAVESLRKLASGLWATSVEVGEVARQARIDVPRQRYEVVLRLLAEGLTDDAVANRIGVSVRTVRNDVASAMAGLDARSRFQAGVRAAQLGLL
ncbi:response regulator transcription factor [Solihabitans fulvus]|uniref:Response regulator transcription factor n=1 Tax=Solihabitans fulvus TaxID=1892852 RepID=A0A5B2XFK4_9PSEU|nr:LuxR C-terminal-related transcriptional regulator [Solihabitans fulvus]KAA2261690.1 response regulator transcription factor [Solihabitans fulvus]